MKIKDVDFKEVEKILKQYFFNAYQEWHMMKELGPHLVRRYEVTTRILLSKYMRNKIINCLTVKGYAKMEEVNVSILLNHRKVGPIHQWSLK